MITARIVLDSIAPAGHRLTTMLLRHPKFIHAEFCRHRSFSLCVSSSRAIPVRKNLEEVRSDELRAAPVYWGAEQKGMTAGGELDPVNRDMCIHIWREAARDAVVHAERAVAQGLHKSLVNRLLEPFLHVNVLVTATEWLNFFGLRLDKAAQPEIRVLAEEMWKVWNESTPTPMAPVVNWHMPFIDSNDLQAVVDHYSARGETHHDAPGVNLHEALIKVSVARCARLSYLSHDTGKRSTVAEDLALYAHLIEAVPIHASPAEHIATPDEQYRVRSMAPLEWRHPELHGNLIGWRQWRKMLPGEACAPLSEQYR